MKRSMLILGILVLFLFSSVLYLHAQDFRIGAEDVVEVGVWKEPDLSRTVIVRPDGKISLPLIGDVRAEGFTPDELTKKIQQRFRSFLSDPVVFVILAEINSSRIYILGKVKKPGMYPLNSNITLLQAIATAGGFAEWAKKSKVIVLRRGGTEDKRIVVNIENLIKNKGEVEDVLLQKGDRIIVP